MNVLILEDNKAIKSMMKDTIPFGVGHTFVSNEEEFLNYVNSGQKADLYFLDDRIPNTEGELIFLFKKNYQHLKEKHPDAKAFYMGTVPGEEQESFCIENKVEMIDKLKISEKIQQYEK